MTDLSPIPFAALVGRMRDEVAGRDAIFDLPVKKWYIPDPDLDLSAVHFGRRASAPLGPAAGPHTQLAQNIVLSWLAGSRILELKTVQVNDRLQIPRPCIHVPNIGFNVEWSQELLVEQSALEYAKAVYLIEILKATKAFGALPENLAPDAFDTIFDISVGYDLEGIRCEKVTGFLDALRAPGSLFETLRAELTGDLKIFRDLPLPDSISDCVTLSTFHGCPADQIESISRYLIEDRGLHTIIKLNPTLLGYDTVRELVVDRLGYDVELDREAFDHDLHYDAGLEILRRLRQVAEDHGSTIGAKFTNTLVVKNRPDYFPTQTDPYMYLSGPPLHVVSMTLMQRFREDLGFELPVSFSAGIDARNFPNAVACGMVPITTCTDLLRQGGYARLPPYLRGLGKAMKKVGVSSREAYVLAVAGHGAEAAKLALSSQPGGTAACAKEGPHLEIVARQTPDLLPRALRQVAVEASLDGDQVVLLATRIAGRLNGREIASSLADDPRYHAERNQKSPRRIDSTLDLYDCINCDLCIAACPNDAIFAYQATPRDKTTSILRGVDGAEHHQTKAGTGYSFQESHQLAVHEGSCNECSNCEVYCPEEGAPFVVKERLFPSRETFVEQSHLDGFFHEKNTLLARLQGLELTLHMQPDGDQATVVGEGLRLALTWRDLEIQDVELAPNLELDTALLWRMKTVWDSILMPMAPS